MKTDSELWRLFIGSIVGMMSILLMIGLAMQHRQFVEHLGEQVPFGWVGVSGLLLFMGICVMALVSWLLRKLFI